MPIFDESSWDVKDLITQSDDVSIELNTETSDGFLSHCLAFLYRVYRVGKWEGKLPEVSSLNDQQLLWGENYTYAIFHKNHKKFGNAVVEAVLCFHKNKFVFFDYSVLAPLFDALDNDKPLPCVPTYYALPEDRHDYDEWNHEWE